MTPVRKYCPVPNRQRSRHNHSLPRGRASRPPWRSRRECGSTRIRPSSVRALRRSASPRLRPSRRRPPAPLTPSIAPELTRRPSPPLLSRQLARGSRPGAASGHHAEGHPQGDLRVDLRDLRLRHRRRRGGPPRSPPRQVHARGRQFPRGARPSVTRERARRRRLRRHPPPPVPPVSSYETTYARFHELDPAADARVFREQADDERAVGGYPAGVNPARPDEPVARDSRAFFSVNATRRDFYDDSERDAKTGGGRSGARGPLTRHAEECGARNASSVWADEFAEAR